MFVNFNDAIKNNNTTQNKIPSIVLEQMSKDLPGNLFYESDNDGYAYISGFNKVNNLIFDVPEAIAEEVGDKDISKEDIFLYSYNSQEPIKLKPAEEKYIDIDNGKIPIEKFVRSLNAKNKVENGFFYVIPPEFPKKSSILLSDNEYEKRLSFERVPNNSIKYGKFKAHCDGIYLTMLIPFSEEDNAKIQISYSLDEIKDYNELIKCISLYNSVLKGNGKINNINIKHNGTSCKTNYDDLIVFLNKVESIENILSKKFDLYTGNISYGLARKVEGLYQNLIKNTPIKNYRKIESITFEDEPQNISSEKQKYAFLYKTNISHDILGCKFELPAIICIYAISCKLKQYKEAWKADIIYDSESYSTVMCFKDIADLNKFADNFKDAVTKMNNYVDVNNLLP